MDNGNNSGLDFIPQMFVFVSGIAMFKPNFKLALANGISRKTEFTATLLSAISVAAVFTILNFGVGCLYSTVNDYSNIFQQSYSEYTFPNSGVYYLTAFIFETLSTFSYFVTGYFIGALYYRMNKALKIIVSVGVPVIFFIGLPVTIGILGKDSGIMKLIMIIAKFIDKVVSNPYYSIIAILFEIIVTGFFTFLLMRRASIKEQG